MLLFQLDMRGQERRRRTILAICLFTWHVPTRRLSRLLLLCWLRILMVRLQEWAGLRRVVMMFVMLFLLDCVCRGGNEWVAVDSGGGGDDVVDFC
jgi:hypothetical protein